MHIYGRPAIHTQGGKRENCNHDVLCYKQISKPVLSVSNADSSFKINRSMQKHINNIFL